MDSEPQRNPTVLPLVTFDNNALVAVRRDEPIAPDVRTILEMNRAGLITANVTAMIELEAQREEDRLKGQDLIRWIQSLGIARANIFTRPRDVGFSTPDFPDGPTFDLSLEQAFKERLFALLHPTMPSRWPVYFKRECEQLSPFRGKAAHELWHLRWGLGQGRIPPLPTPYLDMLSLTDREALREWVETRQRKWMNAACDVEGLFIHVSLAIYTTHPEHAVFVTSDGDFHRRTKLDALRAINFPGRILRPAEAVEFLRGVTGIPESTEVEG
jgi:hypothetical protein